MPPRRTALVLGLALLAAACAPGGPQDLPAVTAPAPTALSPLDPTPPPAMATASPPAGLILPAATAGITWTTHSDAALGFALDYPAAYLTEPYLSWGCAPQVQAPPAADGTGLRLRYGMDQWLTTARADGLSLEAYVERILAQYPDTAYPTLDAEALREHDPPGLIVSTVIMHHPNQAAYFERGGVIFSFGARLSLACSIPEASFAGDTLFHFVVRSFRFTHDAP